MQVSDEGCGAGSMSAQQRKRNHHAQLHGEQRQAKAIQRTITRLLNGVQRLTRRLPEGALDFVWIHTMQPKDQHTQLYTCESVNLQVLSLLHNRILVLKPDEHVICCAHVSAQHSCEEWCPNVNALLLQGFVRTWLKAQDKIQPCKVYNRMQQEAVQQPERTLRVDSLGHSHLGDVVKALFESKMMMDGFKANEYVFSKGFDAFQAIFVARGLPCWWPAAHAAHHDSETQEVPEVHEHTPYSALGEQTLGSAADDAVSGAMQESTSTSNSSWITTNGCHLYIRRSCAFCCHVYVQVYVTKVH